MNIKCFQAIVIVMLFNAITPAIAFSWHDLWVTKDQQAKTLMDQGQFKAANDTFLRDDWRATAAYRAKDFEQAAKIYQSIQQEDADYNKGNALAHMGKYQDAIGAYNKTLAINPNHQDALHNRKILEELLKKEKEEKKDQQNKDQQNQQNKDQQDQGKQDQNKQNKDQQKQDKQDQNKQNKDQQKQDKQNQNKQNQDQPKVNPQEKPKTKTTPSEEQTRDLREKQRAKEQWLNLIPDDPGGLLREKFLRDHLRRQPMWNQ